MKKTYFIIFLLITYQWVQAQTSYIINTPNSSTAGANNTAVGPNAGRSLGNYNSSNTFIGAEAGRYNSIGSDNVFIGYQAGNINSSGWSNVHIGSQAGVNDKGSIANVFIGNNAGANGIFSIYNVSVGYWAGAGNQYGISNINIGTKSGFSNQTGVYNLMLGDSSGYNNKTSNNIFIGSKTGFANVNGGGNTFIGFQSGYNAVADSNTFIGYQSGYTTTTGNGNIFFGTLSGKNNTTGNHNTFVGNGAGPSGSDANDNVYIGFNTGNHDSGSRNTLLGTGADAQAQNLTNATAIGAGATVTISDAVILGNKANVGIGTSAPVNRLEVVSQSPNTSGLSLTNLTTSSPTSRATDQFLTVNETGEVVKARYQLRINHPSEWSDKVFSPSYSLRPLTSVAAYVNQHSHLPGVPSAEQVANEGVDLLKMNATLLEKVEELTLYSILLEKTNQRQEARIDQLEKQQKQEIADLKKLVNQLLKKQ
ncbi:hypothetical protein GCM10028819_13660 [Spirosoma humi]